MTGIKIAKQVAAEFLRARMAGPPKQVHMACSAAKIVNEMSLLESGIETICDS
jgi:hypothetical protein